jgi:ABC-type sugar transport system permease subunit
MVPIVVLVLGLVAVPVGYTAYYSLTNYAGLNQPQFAGFTNFRNLFGEVLFRRIILNNVLLVIGLVSWVTVPFLFAVLLHGRRRADVLRTVLFIPALLPPVVVGLVFRILLAQQGPLNGVLHTVGLGAFAAGWLTNTNLVLISIVLVITWAVMGSGILFYSAGLASLPHERVEAARVDGAEWRHIVWHVYRPALRRVMWFWLLLLTVSTVTGFYPWIFGLTQGGPGISSTTLDYDVYQQGILSGNYGTASAIAVFSIAFLCVVLATIFGLSLVGQRAGGRLRATPIPRYWRSASWVARSRTPSLSIVPLATRRTAAHWFRTLCVVLAVISVVVPLLWTVRMAFRPVPEWLGNQASVGGGWTLANFSDVWTGAHLNHGLINSAIIVPLGAALATVLSSLAGFALAKLQLPLRRGFIIGLALAVFIPLPAIAIPVFNEALKLGYVDIQPGVSVVYAALFASWGALFMYAYFRDLHDDLIDSARIDGASSLQIFVRVAVPLAWPAIVAVFVIDMLIQWNELIIALVLLPDAGKQTATVSIASLSTQYSAYGPYIAAGVLITALPIMLIYAFGQRYMRANVLGGAVKG